MRCRAEAAQTTKEYPLKKTRQSPAEPAGRKPSTTLNCPLCGGSVTRTPRRHLDRLLGLLVALRRYRCLAFGCQWEGNLRPRPAERHS